DGERDSNVATVSLTVRPVNDAPVTDDGAVSTDEDTVVPIALSAHDVDSAVLDYALVTRPAHGRLAGTPPNLSYTPDRDFNGDDSFTFVATDGELDSNIATVSITVRPVNDAPVARDQAVATDEDAGVGITLEAADVDGPSIA